MNKHVFISHASKDKGIADRICSMLEERGLACWIAPRDIQPGKDYAEEIIRGIELTSATVLILSEHANESTFVKKEIERAVSKAKAVFPVRIREVTPSPGLEFFISNSQWVDAWQSPIDAKMDQLASSISSLVGQPVIQLTPHKKPINIKIFVAASVFAVVAGAAVYWGGNKSSQPAELPVPTVSIQSSAPAPIAVNIAQQAVPKPAPAPSTVTSSVSSNPRKELASLGVQWDSGNFGKALRSGDTETAILFLRGGMNIEGSGMLHGLIKYSKPDVQQAYLNGKTSVTDLICEADLGWTHPDNSRAVNDLVDDIAANSLTELQRKVIKKACGTPKFKALMSDAVENNRRNKATILANHQAELKQWESTEPHCLSMLNEDKPLIESASDEDWRQICNRISATDPRLRNTDPREDLLGGICADRSQKRYVANSVPSRITAICSKRAAATRPKLNDDDKRSRFSENLLKLL